MNTTRRMPSGFYPAVPLFVVMSALCVHGVSAAIGGIEGHARHPMVDGYPGLGYVELYEYNVWVCRQGDETALPFRTGAPPEAAIRYNGFFQFPKFADGNYTLILAQPLFFARSRIIPHVAIENGQWVQQHIEPAFDYSMGRTEEWDPEWASLWHQTFVARGKSITRIKARLAGTAARNLRISVHADDGTPSPVTWPQVGNAKVRYTGEGNTYLTDIFVAWTSGEVPTTPGNRYAVRLSDAEGNADFTPFRIQGTAENYDSGTAFKNGVATDFDLHMLICSDSDGTVVTKGIVEDFNGNQLAGWGNEWGQSFTAGGHSLAGFDLWFAHDQSWQQEAVVTIHREDRLGEQIGPTKGTKSAYQTPGSGWMAVPYGPGEVVLEPGERYYLKLQSGGMNCYLAPAASEYAEGIAYRDGAVLPRDLYMNIYEYDEQAAPVVPSGPLSVWERTPLLINGAMEEGATGTGGQIPDGWIQFRLSGSPTYWFEQYGMAGTKAARLIGGAINDTVFDAGLVQRVDGLNPERTYQVRGHLASNLGISLLHWGMIGYDLSGQTANPNAATVRWIPLGGLSEEWKGWESPALRPSGSSISVWLRAGTTSRSYTFFVDFDEVALDEIVLEETPSMLELY